MKKWIVIDDCTSKGAFCDIDELKATTKEEAIEEATLIWNRLHEHDKARRDGFMVAFGDPDADDLFDDLTDCYTIK